MVIRRSVGRTCQAPKFPPSLSSSWAFLGIPTVIKSLKIGDDGGNSRNANEGRSLTLTRATTGNCLALPSWEWKPVLFGNQKGNHGREAGRARHGDWNVRECTYAELPTAFFSSPIHSQRVSEKKAFFNFKQKENFTLN